MQNEHLFKHIDIKERILAYIAKLINSKDILAIPQLTEFYSKFNLWFNSAYPKRNTVFAQDIKTFLNYNSSHIPTLTAYYKKTHQNKQTKLF